MEEVWKDILGYEGIYQISDFGNVRVVATHNCDGRLWVHV